MSRARAVPPTLPVPSSRALAHGLMAALWPSRYEGEIERQLAGAFPAATALPFSTGRAALAAAIMAAMRATGRDVVVLPAFTSYSVAAAAAFAGARVRLCDVDPATLDFDARDLRSCVDGSTAAVVFGNLYGFPSDASAVSWIRERGSLAIDDAAQALGAADAAGLAGWRGDLGVLSFGRGKCVTTGDGGILLVRRPELEATVAAVQRLPSGRGVRTWVAAGAIRACASSWLFELVTRIPRSRIGESHYDPRIELACAPASVRGLAVDLAAAAARQLEARTQVARMWLEGLRRSSRVSLVTPRVDAVPAYLRFPVFARGSMTRQRIAAELGPAGFRYVLSYPDTLDGLDEFRRHCEPRPTPGAQRIARTVLALPCHAHVPAAALRGAARLLSRDDAGSGEPMTEGELPREPASQHAR